MIYVAVVFLCVCVVAWRAKGHDGLGPYLCIASYSAVPILTVAAGLGLGTVKSPTAFDNLAILSMLAASPIVTLTALTSARRDLRPHEHAFAGVLVIAVTVAVVAGSKLVV